MRVIADDGEQLGIMGTRDAQKVAQDRGLDLIEIVPNADPPVCKIMDFGKYRYEISKKDKIQKKHQHVTLVKEIFIQHALIKNLNEKIKAAFFSHTLLRDSISSLSAFLKYESCLVEFAF